MALGNAYAAPRSSSYPAAGQSSVLGTANPSGSSYSATSGDSVVLASAPLGGQTISLPAASSVPRGKPLEIYKVDLTTQPVSIISSGSDLIAGATYWTFFAPEQNCDLRSDGVSRWVGKCTPQLHWIGTNQDPSAASALATSSNVYVNTYNIPSPFCVSGIKFGVGTAGGKMAVGLTDYAGITIASSTLQNVPGTGIQSLNFVNSSGVPICVCRPSGTYGLAISADNGVVTFVRNGTGGYIGAYTMTQSAGGIPASISFATVATRYYTLTAVVCGSPSI